MSRVDPKWTLTDRLVEYFSPRRGLARRHARQAVAAVSSNFKATQKGRYNRDRKHQGGTEDEIILPRELFEIRDICYDLDRDNGIAQAVVDRVVENVFGAAGYVLKPDSGDEDRDKFIAEDFNEWMVHEADYRRDFHGWELLELNYRGSLVGGDAFLQWIEEDNGSLNAFEADRVLNPSGHGTPTINKMKLVHGIARNRRGVKKWLWVADKIPKYGYARPQDGRAIRADDIFQLLRPRRVTQGRGLPALTPVIDDFDDIEDLILYNKLGLKALAAKGFFIETEYPTELAEFMRDTVIDQLRAAGGDERVEELDDPLSVRYLRTGERIQSVESNRPGNNFEKFFRLMNRLVGLPLGLPYELVMLDFSQVNFASSRQLLNQAIRRFRKEQVRVARQASQIYWRWLNTRIENGHYGGQMIPGIRKHSWGVPGWPSPNPLHDAQAAKIGIQWGFNSRTNVARNNGDEIEQILAELAAEQAPIEGLYILPYPPPAQPKSKRQENPNPEKGAAA